MPSSSRRSPARRATEKAGGPDILESYSLPPMSLKSVRSASNNLPIHLASFIGRDKEIVEVKALIGRARLVTLTGAGGSGKSRLAQQVAAGLIKDFPNGVWLAELAAVSDPSLVPKMVAQALGVTEHARRPLIDTVNTFLRPKSLLLLLDNCAHLVSACAHLVAALMGECPGLRILATSQEGLRVEGEFAYRLPGLSLPGLEPLPPLERLKQCDAVRLFTERAIAVLPTFEVTGDNAEAVAQICSHLDGIPLAIEMAAARMKVLSAQQIADRLGDRFRLLTRDNREGLPKHQTLRAAMDWSYNLLSPKERLGLHRLSVFHGGCTLEAAAAVCADDGVEAQGILELLTQLVDKSLLVAETRAGAGRYRLLETVQQYGWDRLVESGEADAIRRRHRDWCVTLAEEADRELRGPRQELWLRRLKAEHANLRAALEVCETDADGAEAQLRLTGALHWFWSMQGHWSEARRWLDAALARSVESPPSTVPKVMKTAAYFAWRKGEYDRAIALGEQGLVLCRELGDRKNGAQLLLWLGIVALRQGDHERATALYEESVSLCRDLGETWLSSMAISQLGAVARDQGDTERAVAFHLQALALAKEAEDKSLIASQLRNLGTDEHRRGDYRQAAAYHRDGLTVSRDVGAKWLIEECLRGVARAEAAQGHYRKAARVLGASEVLRDALGWQIAPRDQADHDECAAAARAALEESAYAAAWAEGRAMTLDQAADYALAPGEGVLFPGPPRQAGERGQRVLTSREREIAGLIACGLSNREIASRLVITGRTAESHVQHILAKLAFHSRSQIATWAVEQGLHTSPTTDVKLH